MISHHFSSSVSIEISIFLIYYFSLSFSSCQIYINKLICPFLVDQLDTIDNSISMIIIQNSIKAMCVISVKHNSCVKLRRQRMVCKMSKVKCCLSMVIREDKHWVTPSVALMGHFQTQNLSEVVVFEVEYFHFWLDWSELRSLIDNIIKIVSWKSIV